MMRQNSAKKIKKHPAGPRVSHDNNNKKKTLLGHNPKLFEIKYQNQTAETQR